MEPAKMAQIIKLGEPPIEVLLKPSARARRLSLRISAVDGRVSLSLPRSARRSDALAFLQEKEAWVRMHLEKRPDTVIVQPGTRIPLEGELHQVVVTPGGRARVEAGQLCIPAQPAKVGMRAKALMTQLARTRLMNASEKYASALGLQFSKITLRDTRSRWGSCTTEGNLMYSWRLIMTPPEVLNYVAAHEVSHLMEMNHSPAFWSTVETLMPDFAGPRIWLRQNGASLHRFQF